MASQSTDRVPVRQLGRGLTLLFLFFDLSARLSAAASQEPIQGQVGSTWELGTLQNGQIYPTSITAQNIDCPGKHTFLISTEGLPWLRTTGPTRLKKIKSGQAKTTPAVLDLRDVAAGEHTGVVEIRCLTCPPPPVCVQNVSRVHVHLVVQESQSQESAESRDTPRVPRPCQDEHKHSVSDKKSKRVFQTFKLIARKNGKTIARKWGRYKPKTGKYLDGDGLEHDPDTLWKNHDPFAVGVDKVEEQDVDVLNEVGFYILRIDPPYGDIRSKGWFGSDEHDELRHDIELRRSKWLKANQWESKCVHRGIAHMESEISSHTMLKKVGGDAFGGGYAGSIQPTLSTSLINRNVAGGGVAPGVFDYKQTEVSTTVITASAGAGISLKKGEVKGGAEVKVTAGLKFESTVPDLFFIGFPLLEKSGAAESKAENEIKNRFRLGLFTNDMVAAWDIYIKSIDRRLDINGAPEDK